MLVAPSGHTVAFTYDDPPTVMHLPDGLTVTELTSVSPVTFTVQQSDTLPSAQEAVIVAVPFDLAYTTPPLTVATSVLLSQ